VSIDVDGHVTIDGQQLPTAGPLSNRNLIINGAMQVAQRGTSSTSQTTSGYKTCDRFHTAISNLGTWTIERVNDAPEGFANSLKHTCTTADASPAANDFIIIIYYVEAQDLQILSYGSAAAKSLTLSFWVKSNRTGEASLDILQSDNSLKCFSAGYTINSANTWEKKTIVIPGDTAGVINNDNDRGFQIDWWINSGSTFTGGTHQNVWAAVTNSNRNASNLGVGGAVNDYLQITGVQLEVGSKATPFEHESYGQTLSKCLRYYEKIHVSGAYGCGVAFAGTAAFCAFRFSKKRDVPNSVTLPSETPGSGAGNTSFLTGDANYPSAFGSFTIGFETEDQIRVLQSGGNGFTAGQAAILWKDSADTGHVRIDAEL